MLIGLRWVDPDQIKFMYAKVINRIFEGYDNVEVKETSIYQYGFLNEQFDRILSVPTFGGRYLAEDSKKLHVQ